MANKNRLKKAKQFAKSITKRIQKQVSKEVQKRRQSIHRYEIPNIEWGEAKIKETEEKRERLERQAHYRFAFTEGYQVYQGVMDIINNVKRDHYRAALHLLDVLENEFATYGKTASLMSIGNAPQKMLVNADIACRYNPGDVRHDGAIAEIREIFEGAKLTPEEMRELEEAIGEDVYEDEI